MTQVMMTQVVDRTSFFFCPLASSIDGYVPAYDVNDRLLYPIINEASYHRWFTEIQELITCDGFDTCK
jgi:hypothetical protein